MTTLFSTINLIGEPAARATELLWQDAMMHLEATNNEVLLPMNVAELIGVENITLLADRLSTLLSKVVRLVDDESINVLRIVPLGTEEREQVLPVGNKDFKRISHAVHAAALTGTIMPAKPEKVRRPPNSFILYRQYHHKSIKAANPGTSNNDISRIIGEKWSNEAVEIKAHFKALAEEMKRKHAINHPAYQYTPRRPHERRRRNMARLNRQKNVKAEALQFLAHDDEGAHFLDNEAVTQSGHIQIDERCLELLNKHGMLFGANGVQPFEVPDNGSDFEKIVNEQLDGVTTIETLVYDPDLAVELDAGFDFSGFVSDYEISTELP